jgi:hypothetical protein
MGFRCQVSEALGAKPLNERLRVEGRELSVEKLDTTPFGAIRRIFTAEAPFDLAQDMLCVLCG